MVGKPVWRPQAAERKLVVAHMSVAALRFTPRLLVGSNRYTYRVLAVRQQFTRLASMRASMHPVRMLACTHLVLMPERMYLALTPEFVLQV